jgi:hypothetical protein
MPSTKTQPPPANLGVGKHQLRALSLRRGDVPNRRRPPLYSEAREARHGEGDGEDDGKDAGTDGADPERSPMRLP